MRAFRNATQDAARIRHPEAKLGRYRTSFVLVVGLLGGCSALNETVGPSATSCSDLQGARGVCSDDIIAYCNGDTLLFQDCAARGQHCFPTDGGGYECMDRAPAEPCDACPGRCFANALGQQQCATCTPGTYGGAGGTSGCRGGQYCLWLSTMTEPGCVQQCWDGRCVSGTCVELDDAARTRVCAP